MIKKKKNNKKEKNHGFTLIELLSTIVIIGIVAGISITIHTSSINKTKENAKILAMNNLKEAAELYIKEQSGKIKWINQYDNYKPIGKYICTTVQDLINAGYFKEDFYKNESYSNKITKNTLIEIHQSNNYSDIDINIHENNVNMKQCLASAMNQNIKDIQLKDIEIYTDRVYFNIADENNTELDYGITYTNKNNQKITNKCENNKCALTNLAPDTNYTFTLCPNKDNTKNCKKLEILTYYMNNPYIDIYPQMNESWDKIINIYFYNYEIYNGGYNYFKSDVNTISEQTVYKCENQNNTIDNNCQTTTETKNIEAGNWYYAKQDHITMTTNHESTIPETPKIYAKTTDESKNKAESSEIIKNLKRKTYVTIRFKPNNGELTTQTRDENGTIYNWKVGSDGLIYLNNEIYEQKITANGYLGTNGLENYDNSNALKITKIGYTGKANNEWTCLEGCNNKSFNQNTNYQGKDFCDSTNNDCTVILGVNWARNFTCGSVGLETTYMGKKWYTIANNTSTCELALKETVGNSSGNKYTDAAGTGNASVYNYIKSFTNGINTLETEYQKNLIITIDTNVTETTNKKNPIDGAYWVSSGIIYDSSQRTSSVLGSSYTYYTSAMPYCTSGTKNSFNEACSSMPKEHIAYNAPKVTTRTKGYYSINNNSSIETFKTVGECTTKETGASSTDWTRGHADTPANTNNLSFTYITSGASSATTANQSKSFRFYMCGKNNDGTNYDNKEMLVFKNSSDTHYSYSNKHTADLNQSQLNTLRSFNGENYIFAGKYSITGSTGQDIDLGKNRANLTGCSINGFCTNYGSGSSTTVKYMYRPHIIVNK